MDRTAVLMLFGGESSEHDVSISSARNVYAAIDDEKFDVHLCYIDRQGKWWLIDEFGAQIDTREARQLLPVLGESKLLIEGDNTDLYVDVLLPILHGRNGEDGTVQGLAQLLHVPIVGCDVTASGTAMNKLATKQILSDNKIPIIPYAVHRAYEDTPDFSKLTMTLGSPLFVKPARAGSSVGVSKVHSEDEFIEALHEAHRHDPIALIEQAIIGQELEVAVLGTPPHHRVSGVGEIIPGEDFYSYDDKYAAESEAKVLTEATIDEDTKQKIRAFADKSYVALDCRGLARIDFILGENGDLYLMEVNTMPGFTNISMYPKLWRKEGISYPQLIEMLIADAIANGTMSTAN
jgi:D-alanine-D-alanine ligase